MADVPKKSLLELARTLIRRWNRKKSTPPPDDPDAYSMAPLRRGPKGRSGAAVAEIEDDSYLTHPPRH
jgi:hypothetical protein